MDKFDPNINPMMRMAMQNAMRQQPQQVAIDPLTPELLKNAVRLSRHFAESLIGSLINDAEYLQIQLYDVLFEVLRPFNSQQFTYNACRAIFFDVYITDNAEGLYDCVAFSFTSKEHQIARTFDDVELADFYAAYETFTKNVYEHFVVKHAAKFEFLQNELSNFAKALKLI